ncbi:uncharacterized protein [Panulirus ornatus]|uniref:uncharacterized protein isoform X2 n=1 Tax=Panulirus ornatus TaxID=150431 RepID=UPI003A8BBCA4
MCPMPSTSFEHEGCYFTETNTEMCCTSQDLGSTQKAFTDVENSAVKLTNQSSSNVNLSKNKGSYLPPSQAVSSTTSHSHVASKADDIHIKVEGQDQQRNLGGILKVVDSYDKVLQLVQAEEKATGMHFVGHRKEGIFNRTGCDLEAFIREGRKHVRYSVNVGTKGRGYDPVPVEYTGVPFIEAGTYVLECHMGNDSGMWNKRRYAANRNKNEKENSQKLIKRRIRSQDTKKTGCPAKVHVKRILRLLDFKIKQNTAAEKDENRAKIMSALKCNFETVNYKPMYYVLLPDLENHKYHVVDFVAGVMVRKGKDRGLHLHQIKKYLETGAYLPSVLLNEKKGIRIASKAFILEDNLMYYIGRDGTEKRVVLYTNEEKQTAFRECHILEKSDEHFDCTQTLYCLAEKYYWTSMAEDVVAMIILCDTCNLNERKNSVEYASNSKKLYQTGGCSKISGTKRHKTAVPVRKRPTYKSSDMLIKSETQHPSEKNNSFVISSNKNLQKCSVINTGGFKVSNDDNPKGTLKVVSSYEEVLSLILAEEKATGMHFVGHRKEGIFDRIGSDMKSFIGEGRKHVRYSISLGTKGRGYDPVPVEYTGIPFIEAGTYVLECHMGNDSGIWNKRRYAANRDKMEEESHVAIKRRVREQNTKKMGCPAKVHIKRILRMPDFKIKKNTTAEREKNRTRIIRALKEDIENVNFQPMYYILLPNLESHKYHLLDIVAGVMVNKGEAGLLHLQQVRHYLETGTHLPSVELKKKNGIRKSSKEFIMEGKTMYYIGKDGTEKRIVPQSEEERVRAFVECHIQKSGLHCDQTETLHHVAEKYYWTGLVEDVFGRTDQCKTCEFTRPNQCYTEPKVCQTIHKMDDGGHLVVIADNTLDLENWGGKAKMQKTVIIQESSHHENLKGPLQYSGISYREKNT